MRLMFYFLVLLDWLTPRTSRTTTPPKPVAISKLWRRVLLSNDEVIPITQFFGDGWADLHWQEGAISCTAGPTRSGKYYAIRLADFERASLH
jgi:hypothetical protein